MQAPLEMTAAETSPTYPDSVYNIVPSGTKWVVQKALSDHSWMYLGRYASRDAASNAVSADKKASVSPSMMYSDMSDSDVSVEDPAIGPAFVEAAVVHVPGHSFQSQLGNGVVKYRGVYKAGNKWRAMITSWIEGVNQYVGLYDTQEEAAAAIAAITGTSVRKAEAKRKPAFDLERYSGVRKYHNVWRAEGYRYGQHRKHLGLFATKDEAQRAVTAYMNSAFGAIADETQLQVEVAASATVTGDA